MANQPLSLKPPNYFALPDDLETADTYGPQNHYDATYGAKQAAVMAGSYFRKNANVIADSSDATNYNFRPNPGAFVDAWTAGSKPNMATEEQPQIQASKLLAWFVVRLQRIQNALPGAP